MENNASRSADPRNPARSDLADPPGRFQLHERLRDKLDELAHLRISPYSIKFPTDAPRFDGGCATISRALLTVSSDLGDRSDKSDHTKKGGMGSNGRIAGGSNHRVLKSKDDGYFGINNANPRRPDIAAKEKWRSRSRNLMMKLLGRRAGNLPSFMDAWSSSSSDLTRRAVAVKKMKISGDPWRVLWLTLREAGFLVEFSHPNIINLDGFVESVSNNMIWLVFPWEDRGNLRDFIASADWEIPERISLINDVARGVEYLHSRKPPVLHGDLKSMNILINSGYHAVITDFGSARRLTTKDLDEEGERTEDPPQAGLLFEATFCASTKTMTLTGNKYTLRWAAPELLNGDVPGLWSDIWALGWVAYEVMTNSIPFQNINDGMVVISVIRGDLPSITSDARMLLIRALCSLMIDCWSIDPRQRPNAKDCCKSIRWMPMITPNAAQTVEATTSRVHSPGLLTEIGNMHALQGDYFNASKFFIEALSIDTDRRARANALQGLAEVHRLRNEYNQAVTLYTEALQIFLDIGDRQRRAYALQGLGDVHRLQNEYRKAIMCYSEVLQICTDLGGRQRRAYALQGLGDVHRVRNEYSQASRFYSEALRIRTDIGDRRGRAEALWGLAEVHRVQNKYSQAMALYNEALQIRTDIGDRQGRANALFGLAEVHRVQNMYTQAIKLYAEVLQIQTDIGDRQGRANTLFSLAEVHRSQHGYGQAVRFYHETLQIRTEIGDKRGRAYALSGLADVHRARNEYNQAITFYSEALRIRTDIGHKRGRAYALWGLAEVHRLQNKYNQALAFFSEALIVFNDIGDGYCGAFTLLGLGDVNRDQDDYTNAILYYEQALESFERIGNMKGAASALERAAHIRRLFEQKEAARPFTETYEIE